MCRIQPVILAVRCARVALPYSPERRAGEGGVARRDVRTEARWNSSNLFSITQCFWVRCLAVTLESLREAEKARPAPAAILYSEGLSLSTLFLCHC